VRNIYGAPHGALKLPRCLTDTMPIIRSTEAHGVSALAESSQQHAAVLDILEGRGRWRCRGACCRKCGVASTRTAPEPLPGEYQGVGKPISTPPRIAGGNDHSGANGGKHGSNGHGGQLACSTEPARDARAQAWTPGASSAPYLAGNLEKYNQEVSYRGSEQVLDHSRGRGYSGRALP